MEMIIVVPASFNRNSVGAAVTSEVCPTVPDPYQSTVYGEQIKLKPVRFFQAKDCGRQFFSSPC